MYAENRIRELRRELERQFFRGNLPSLTISVICMLLLTGVDLVTAWLMQRLVDVVASNASGPGGILLIFAVSFAVFIVAYDVQRYSCSAFVRRAAVQYKNYAFSGILERSVSFVSKENSAKFISAGVAVAFLQLMNFVISPISTVPPILANRKASVELMDKLAGLMSEEAESEGEDVPAELKEGITIRGLGFAYIEGEPVLRDIDLSVPAGGSLAIVGPSGSGKSTLLQLLMGHHRGYEGSICIDGAELRDISPASLYELLSVIQQEVFIFNSSIEKNVTMFGDFEPGQVEAAIEGAGLKALIAGRGLDFVCGENGQNLSGGERQRVSIARSLLKKTPVLLVAVLIGGRLRELGSFEELLEARGFLYSMLTLSAAAED